MDKYKTIYNDLKNQLQSLLTADNTEAITKAVSSLDELSKEHESALTENSNLKNKIVEIVKGTTFKSQSDEAKEHEDQEPLSFEEACKQADKELLENRRK